MARFGAKRPQQTRDTLPIVIIACDDTKTAPSYFAEVRSHLKQRCTLQIVVAPRHGATGSKVIDCARGEQMRLSDTQNASVWAIIDLEMSHKSKALMNTLRARAERDKVKLALSQPCFEVWILAHFIDTGELFSSCDAVLREVKKHWKSTFGQDFPQKKAQADYRKLIAQIANAIERAKTKNASNNQSWTEIWQIGKQLLAFEND